MAVLATLRVDGTVLLSPVYYEWREGAFNVVIETQNVKARHLRRDPRATILVAESEPPLRGVEVRGSARFMDDGVTETTRRIVASTAMRKPRLTRRPAEAWMSSSGSSPTTSGSGISPTSSTAARGGGQPSRVLVMQTLEQWSRCFRGSEPTGAPSQPTTLRSSD